MLLKTGVKGLGVMDDPQTTTEKTPRGDRACCKGEGLMLISSKNTFVSSRKYVVYARNAREQSEYG